MDAGTYMWKKRKRGNPAERFIIGGRIASVSEHFQFEYMKINNE